MEQAVNQSLSSCLAMEKLTYATKSHLHIFQKIWGCLMYYLENESQNQFCTFWKKKLYMSVGHTN